MVDWWKCGVLVIILHIQTSVFSVSHPRELFQYGVTPTSQLLARPEIPAAPLRLGMQSAVSELQVAVWGARIAEAIQLRRRHHAISLHRNLSHNYDGGVAANVVESPNPIVAVGTNASASSGSSSCTSSADVHALLDKIVCGESYLKSLISASKKCNLFGYFDSDHIRGCGADANGTFCRKHERSFPDPDYLAWDVLQQCSLQTHSETCSSSCKSSLSNFAAKFGCCIYVSRVSWFVEDNPHILILSSALWTYCGLKRPNPCSNVPTLPSSTIAGSCTYGCYAYARSALICERVGSQLIDTYNACGRKGTALELGQLCGLNYEGTACFELQFTDNTDYLLSIYTACFKYFSSGVCDKKCRSALVHFGNKYGCCVNVYNGTAFGESSQLLGSIVTQYGLWSRCNVESPGMCTLPSEERNVTYDVEAFCDKILIDGVWTDASRYELYVALLLWSIHFLFM